MPWTTPKSWATNEVVTAANMNTHLRDNVAFLGSPPACSVYNSAPVSVANSTLTLLGANSENYDTDTMHSTSVNTSRITFTTAGRYQVSATVRFATDNDGVRAVEFLVDGATAYAIGVHQAAQVSDTVISGTRMFVLSAAQYVEVRVSHAALNNINVTLEDFSAVLVTVP